METRDLIKSLAGDHTIVLSTHILPEVSQVCQRVVIINKGKVVAIDTPDNLTSRLEGAQSLYVQVDAASNADVGAALDGVPGVTAVRVADQKATITGFEIECQRDHDIRRDLAKAIVGQGWGLLELRPLRMSLEEIFLQLTTQEGTGAPAADAAALDSAAPGTDTNGGASKENG
jgi:ABC-2 type transport system ATP-binding protein